jgi:putative endonuclease
MRTYHVYILSNRAGSVLYVGVTSNLIARVQQHKTSAHPGFTSKYKVNRLVYFEDTSDVAGAIEREKQLKAGSRSKKLALINGFNPQWRDLYDELIGRTEIASPRLEGR